MIRRARTGSSWLERKQARRVGFYLYRWRVKRRKCTACNGSGRYDSDRSPPCGGCDGTRFERYRLPDDERRAQDVARRFLSTATLTEP